ncbi:hypothetical protein vseg_018695 [Gypsophila vaccaria]
MKIQCDVCEKKEAKVYCGADEAALCEGCDHKVHHANKLASKHQRFSLLHPSFKKAPLCDICQEKRAFMFCREDRAILCRECDISIHKTNEHTQTHNRFLLTGVSISASSTPYTTTTNTTNSSPQPNYTNSDSYNTSKMISSTTTSYGQMYEDGSISTNNVMPHQCFMESLPGWGLDDLSDSSYAHDFKNFGYTNDINWNEQVEEESMGSYGSTQDYSKIWDFNHPHQQQQPPLVPTHLPPIFHDSL